MTANNQQNNNFRFALYQEDNLITETVFNADVFNPVVRYSVDIRSDISYIISRLQKVLSKRNLNFKVDVGNGKTYDFLKEYKNQVKKQSKSFYNKLEVPDSKNYTFGKKTINGVEFKFGLYINDNPIVERNFYVEGYNPASRFSIELGGVVNDISKEIYNSLKKADQKHMWDDYDLINTYGMYINQIRDLSKKKREHLLDNKTNSNYVQKIKRSYKL